MKKIHYFYYLNSKILICLLIDFSLESFMVMDDQNQEFQMFYLLTVKTKC